MGNREVRILASEIIPIDKKIRYYATEFPSNWYSKLSNIYKIIKGRDKVTLPNSSLKEALEALPLGIVSVNNLRDDKNKYWIISLDKLNKSDLLSVIRSWCTIEFISKENSEESIKDKIIDMLNNFKADEIEIEERALDLSTSAVLQNGTSNPDHFIYSILGNYITYEIAEKQIPITIGDEIFYFVKDKNTLISFPPSEYKGSYYSLKISFEVKTIAGYDKPIVLIETGISRWANGKFANNIGWKNKTSVLIKHNKKIGYTLGNDAITRNKEEKCYVWADDVKEILEDSTLSYLPEVNKVIEESVEYLGNNKDYTLLITYNNDNTSKLNHPVKKGMSMEEQYQVYKKINEIFEFLQPIHDNEYKNVRKSFSGVSMHENHKIKNYFDELSRNEKEVIIEIVYINKETPVLIAKQILESINKGNVISEFDDTQEISIEYNGLAIIIKGILAGNLIEPIDSFDRRVEETIEFFKQYDSLILTVVEIYDKSYYKINKDPKFAIRKGLYETKRFNQFINADNIMALKSDNEKKQKEAEEKVKPLIENVILELFRQLGIMHDEIGSGNFKTVSEEIEFIGFNLLSTNRNKNRDTLSFPIAVSIKSGSKNIYVKTPINDWMLYREAILELGANNKKNKRYDDNEVNTFFRSILNDANEGNSLVMVDTSNRLNSVLKDFQDKEVKLNSRYNEYKNVRIVRVKSNQDVPKVVGIRDEEDVSFASGLKKIVENVYYSLEQKGITYTSISKSHRKLDKLNKEFKMPSALEIIPVKINENDDVEDYIYAVHKLRRMNLTYSDFSAVPVVNHLAKSFQEVLIVKDNEENNNDI